MRVLAPASLIVVFVCLAAARGQEGPEGVLIYHEPLTSYAEALEYQSFRQDNALFSTVVTVKNVRKQIKSGGVIAVVPYPPAGFEPLFEETAATTLRTINSLEAAHPQVKPPLEIAKQKWASSLAAFQQIQKAPTTPLAQRTGQKTPALPPGARLTRATVDAATIIHTSGVSTIPLSELSSAQVLSLNATSRTIQLPLGTEQTAPAAPIQPNETDLTRRIEAAGRSTIAISARTLGTTDQAFSVWTFFVILPALVLVLLVAVLLLARRPRLAALPRRRPLS